MTTRKKGARVSPTEKITAPVHSSWLPLLKNLENDIFGRGYIAGGAARDSICDRDPKDLDIFLPDIGHSLEYRSEKVQAFCAKHGYTYIRGTNAAYFPGVDGLLQTVHTIAVPGLPYEVQLIGLRPFGIFGNETWSADYVLSRIDFGLCRVAYSVDGWKLTHEFCADYMLNRLSIIRCDDWSQFQAICKRYMRLVEKYHAPLYVYGEQFPSEAAKAVAEGSPLFETISWAWHYSPEGVRALATGLGH